MEKTYLADLLAAGITTIPTFFVTQETPRDVVALCLNQAWGDVGDQAAISSSAFGARRFQLPHEAGSARLHAERFLTERNIMIQPYWPRWRPPASGR